MKRALKEGAGRVATGHYARIRNGRLLKGKDKEKDQTYFLYNLTEKQLGKILFPVGEYTKPEVRKMAKKFNLPVAEKKDSQGVCFVGEFDMKDFLKKYINPRRGKIMLGKKVIGEHDGVFYYTIGQRHGLGLSGGPYFVTKKDIKKNVIYVSKDPGSKELQDKEAVLKNVNWINDRPAKSFDAGVKIRYRTDTIKARVIPGKQKTKIKFLKPVRALTSGQSAVIYKGQVVVGGGVII
jgi:tRNA-specific 2-thiouridylase